MFENYATHFDRTLARDGVRTLEYLLSIAQEHIWTYTCTVLNTPERSTNQIFRKEEEATARFKRPKSGSYDL